MWETILIEYGIFFLKIVTLLIAALLLLVLSTKMKSKQTDGQVTITDLSEKLLEQQEQFEKELLDKKAYKQLQEEREQENLDQETDKPIKRLFVLDFDGDIQAKEVDNLREEITAILTLASQGDEVLVRLESPGGLVYGYGLGASQLLRLKDKQLPLTISVDKVAASGGYLMAAVADRIVAAPFALVGSIGVVAEIPNIHRLLKKHEIDVDVMTAGKYKRTLTFMGENTAEGRDKFQEELNEVHHLFKDFVQENRPILDIEQVSTGETWYGTSAKKVHLVDEIATSDDLILNQIHERQVLLVKFEEKKSLINRIGVQVETSLSNLILKLVNKSSSIR
ncbi:protease SohB [Streptococcus suis]|uniref:Secreted protease n=1 Tax=Streptococcus suis R61 TaxID=996306 RepID=A0AA87F9G1_STRSU|nr:protease SohB [Streptococcus suis]ATZ04442.1 protease SohB [Streptococcus suis]EHC03592.1 putative secreted protease [Streptococcus suis R61]MBY5001900.1 protease SohB [Streptococcus suis]MBY5012956.1 protease SohB [Streptococcus suis]MBY5019738.1 protease SohB [Streptococcus suis]